MQKGHSGFRGPSAIIQKSREAQPMTVQKAHGTHRLPVLGGESSALGPGTSPVSFSVNNGHGVSPLTGLSFPQVNT